MDNIFWRAQWSTLELNGNTMIRREMPLPFWGNLWGHFKASQNLSCTVAQSTSLEIWLGRSYPTVKYFWSDQSTSRAPSTSRGGANKARWIPTSWGSWETSFRKNYLFDVDSDIHWARGHDFKLEYHINRASMCIMVKDHTKMLKLKESKQTKKMETYAAELQHYITFLDGNEMPHSMAWLWFCLVTIGVPNTSFSKWDVSTSTVEVREDWRGCPFGLIDFKCIIGFTRQGIKGMPFYEPFMPKFMAFKLLDMRELHVVDCRIGEVFRHGRHVRGIHKRSSATSPTIHMCLATPMVSLLSTRSWETSKWGQWAYYSLCTINLESGKPPLR